MGIWWKKDDRKNVGFFFCIPSTKDHPPLGDSAADTANHVRRKPAHPEEVEQDEGRPQQDVHHAQHSAQGRPHPLATASWTVKLKFWAALLQNEASRNVNVT
jgi:hypothetical protein